MAEERGARILSLCSGYGGLDMVVERLTAGTTVAYAENNTYASLVMARHWPGVPNLGDITAVDWNGVNKTYAPDVIAAGFPCTDISDAGPRTGIKGERSGIWKNVAEAVGTIRPRLVFLENVAAIRSRGLDVVAQDMAGVGYELWWTCLRASAVGAAHPRNRWFGIARPAVSDAESIRRPPRGPEPAEQQRQVRRVARCGSESSSDAMCPGLEVRGLESARDERATAQ